MGFYHHDGHRDSQRQRVYDAEGPIRYMLRDNADPMQRVSYGGACALIASVWAAFELAPFGQHSLMSGAGPLPGLKLGKPRSRYFSGGNAYWDGITLAQLACRPNVVETQSVVHELAHCIVFNTVEPDTTAAHGPEFAAWMLAIDRYVFGDDVADALRVQYTVKRVKCAAEPKRAPRPSLGMAATKVLDARART